MKISIHKEEYGAFSFLEAKYTEGEFIKIEQCCNEFVTNEISIKKGMIKKICKTFSHLLNVEGVYNAEIRAEEVEFHYSFFIEIKKEEVLIRQYDINEYGEKVETSNEILLNINLIKFIQTLI